MAMYGCVWLCRAVYVCVWPCTTMYCYVCLCIAVYGYLWACRAMYAGLSIRASSRLKQPVTDQPLAGYFRLILLLILVRNLK